MCPGLSKLQRRLSVTVAAVAYDNVHFPGRLSFVIYYIMQKWKGTSPGSSASMPEDLLVELVQPEDAILLHS